MYMKIILRFYDRKTELCAHPRIDQAKEVGEMKK